MPKTTVICHRLQTDLFLSHLFPQPLRKLDPSVIVAGGPDAPDESKGEPGFNQFIESCQLLLCDWFLTLKKKVRYTASPTVLGRDNIS